MRPRHLSWFALAAALGVAGAALAAAPREAVVARVGSLTVTAGELEQRLAAVPRFQLETFGPDAPTIRRRFLDQIVVPELLYALGAHDRHVDQKLVVAQALARAQSNATLRAVRAQVGTASDIPGEEIVRYYREHSDRYDTPARIGLWRILCKTREEATAVLDAAKKEPTPERFNELAREHSLDKATNMRGGNLGFIAADGSSNEAGLKVDPALPKAAEAVKDGELVPAPVPEGEAFAVVWRRGSVAASHRPLEQVSAQIRDTMFKEKRDKAQQDLLADLRQKNLKELNVELLKQIDISPGDGAIVPRRRPGQVPPIGASSSPR